MKGKKNGIFDDLKKSLEEAIKMKKSKDNEVEEGLTPMEVITYLLEKEKNASDLEGTELLRLSQRNDIPQWFESVVNNEIITRVRGY